MIEEIEIHGVGTVSEVMIRKNRIGSVLIVEGHCHSGTPYASPVRIYLDYEGKRLTAAKKYFSPPYTLNTNVGSFSTLERGGHFMLYAQPGRDYLTVEDKEGNNILGICQRFAFWFEVEIEEWQGIKDEEKMTPREWTLYKSTKKKADDNLKTRRKLTYRIRRARSEHREVKELIAKWTENN